MAFSFAPSSQPAFGATSTPAFSFAGASSTPAFGATSTPAFGAAATPAFGAQSTPSLFGGVSTPAFAFASSPSLFGATTTPAFGAAAPNPSSGFGPAPATTSTFSLFGGAAQQQQQQPQLTQQQQQHAQAAAQLVTKDNRPLTHSTKWEDLSPQAQQYLLELEKVISSCREECRQLDGEERLQEAAGARSGLEDTVKSLSQSISALEVRVRADTEDVEGVRDSVMQLLRHTEAALHTFKRTHAWREAARAAPGQPLPSHMVEQLGGPVVLPSSFLVETIAALHERLKSHETAAAELEAALQRDGGGRWTPGSFVHGFTNEAGSALTSLQYSVANLHDCLMRTAAQLQTLDDRMAKIKVAKLAELRRGGDFSDPFDEAERQGKRQEMNGAGGKSGGSSGMQQRQQAPSQQQQHLGPVSLSPQQGMNVPLVPPMTGLFGTASPSTAFGASPAGGGGLFGGVDASGQPSGKRSARGRR